MMMILGVSPLRGFPVERRGIGHLVPILGGRRLAGLVRLGGGVCPSAGCPVGIGISSTLKNCSKRKLFQSYCTSFYGSELWSLNSKGLEECCIAWRKGARRIFNMSYQIQIQMHLFGHIADPGDLC